MSEETPKNPSMEEQPSSILSHTLVIGDGCDVIHSLADYALRRQRTIAVLSGSGTVSNVTLSQWPGVTYHEKFEIVSISGSFLPPPAAPRFSGLSVYFTGEHGQVVGGRVLRPMIASGPVVIMATSFSNTVYEEIGKEPLKAEASDIGLVNLYWGLIEEYLQRALEEDLEASKGSSCNTETATEASVAQSSEQKPEEVGLPDFRFLEVEEEHRLETEKEPLMEESLQDNLEGSKGSPSNAEPLLEQNPDTSKDGIFGEASKSSSYDTEALEQNAETSDQKPEEVGLPEFRFLEVEEEHRLETEKEPLMEESLQDSLQGSKGSPSNAEPLLEQNPDTSKDGMIGEASKSSSYDTEALEQNAETSDQKPEEVGLPEFRFLEDNLEASKSVSYDTEPSEQNQETAKDGMIGDPETVRKPEVEAEQPEVEESSKDKLGASKGFSSENKVMAESYEDNLGAGKGSSSDTVPLEGNPKTSNDGTTEKTESLKGSSSNTEPLGEKPETSNNETTEKTESSEGSPSNTELLEQNPETVSTINFSFGLSRAMKLKTAILALTDGQLNKKGTGMIEVNSKKVEITVQSDRYGVCGYLMLYAPMLLNFKFEKPLKKMINLNSVSEYLDMVGDHSALTISHIDGSNELSFKSGGLPVIEFGVELHEIDPGFVEFPNITLSCECVIPREILLMVLNEVDDTKSKFASVEVSDYALLFHFGREAEAILLEYEDIKLDHRELCSLKLSQPKSMTRGLVKGQSHCSWFQWPHCEALRKANQLDYAASICLVTDPKTSVMFRFPLREFGDLLFLKKGIHYKENYGDRGEDEDDVILSYVDQCLEILELEDGEG